ncbi:hypothetical protein GOBAR_AA38983 [Gossypium barbadense]|uniref:GIR1-like zinc ribbon domain-containing protein n=1 Tax=Gossypium barbadense TaxID=3634 RepID=A0A2P5VSC4_GOSBA|nr:hypothetical protein GOBAR_AA38983 [Gossypium barbadense]
MHSSKPSPSFLKNKVFKVPSKIMSGRRNGPKLELKLNLSPPRRNPRMEPSPTRSATVSPTSPPSSCLMYVMLSEDESKCPKCKSTVLLDFLHDTATTTKARKS